MALIDFEMSGFYPEYWEYVNAKIANDWTAYWRVEVDKFLERYPEELATEKFRLEYFSNDGGTI